MKPFLIALLCFATAAAAAPSLVSISGNSIDVGWPPFSFDANGSGFVPGSTVYWGATPLVSTFVSASKVSAAVPAAVLVGPSGAVSITVRNPDGAVSGPLTWYLQPVVTSVSPSYFATGNADVPITVNGLGFTPADYISFNCAGTLLHLATTFVSSTSLRGTISNCLLRSLVQVPFEIGVRDDTAGTFSRYLSLHIGIPFYVTSLSPASAVAGGPAFVLTVNGSFDFGSTVQWNGAALSSTMVSNAQLTANVPANLLATPGTAVVSVVSPDVAGSIGSYFLVATPTPPSIVSANPTQIDAGAAAFTLSISGARFVQGSTVLWGATPLSTTFVSSSLLAASVPASLAATSGKFTLTVKNPDGTVSSAYSQMLVQPVLTAISPTSAYAGASSVTITATGVGFTANDLVRINSGAMQSDLSTSFAGSATLTAQLPAATLASAATISVSIFDRLAGAVSRPQTFTVKSALPVIDTLSPAFASAGGAAFTLTATGSGFASGAAVQWNGIAVPTTFVNSGQLLAQISASQIAISGSAALNVANPDGAVSNLVSLAITPAAPVTSSSGVVNAASSLPSLAPGALISIYGSNLAGATASAADAPLPTVLGGTSVFIDGKVIPLLYVSPAQINGQIPYETQPGTVKLMVRGAESASAAVDIRVAAAGPGVMTVLPTRHALLWNTADNTLNAAESPAKPGQYVIAFLTGQGAVDPPVASGAAAPQSPLSFALAGVQVKVGGQTAQVPFAGLAPGFVGLLQLNILIPDVPPGEQPFEVSIGGVAANQTVISIGAQ